MDLLGVPFNLTIVREDEKKVINMENRFTQCFSVEKRFLSLQEP
jgi:hypothetical protein